MTHAHGHLYEKPSRNRDCATNRCLRTGRWVLRLSRTVGNKPFSDTPTICDVLALPRSSRPLSMNLSERMWFSTGQVMIDWIDQCARRRSSPVQPFGRIATAIKPDAKSRTAIPVFPSPLKDFGKSQSGTDFEKMIARPSLGRPRGALSHHRFLIGKAVTIGNALPCRSV